MLRLILQVVSIEHLLGLLEVQHIICFHRSGYGGYIFIKCL